MGSSREVLCLGFVHNITNNWNDKIFRFTECDLYVIIPIIIFAFLTVFALPYITILVRHSSRPRRWTRLYFLKHLSYAVLLGFLFWKFANIASSSNVYTWNYLYPAALCTAVLFQLIIVNYESVRDRPNSAVYFLCCVLLFAVTLASAWTTGSYNLQPPASNLLSLLDPHLPVTWNLPISQHELNEYLVCVCAFLNLLLAFFSDRLIPSSTVFVHSVGDCDGQGLDLPANEDKPLKSCDDEKETSNGSKQVSTLCPEKYVSVPSRFTFFWVTKLIIRGYRKALQPSHLWTLEDKHLSANIEPSFLHNISRYLHVDIARELDVPHTSTSQFSIVWPSQEVARSSGSDEKKSFVGNSSVENDIITNTNPLANNGPSETRSLFPSGRRSTVADTNTFNQTGSEGGKVGQRGSLTDAIGSKAKMQYIQKTTAELQETAKKLNASNPTSILPNVQIRITGRPSKPKTPKKISISGDLESGLLATDVPLSSSKSGISDALKATSKTTSKKLPGGFVKALFATFGCRVFIAGIFKLCHDICLLTGPVIFKLLLKFMEPESKEPHWHGYAFACLMFFTSFVQSVMLHQYFRIQSLVGMDMRTSVISTVYRKSLLLSAEAHCDSTTGGIINLMSIDAARFSALMLNIHAIWSAPFQVIVAVYLLWRELGPSVLVGISVLVLMIPINIVMAKKSKTLQEKQLKTTDGRIKLINEVLNGIRVLKLYAWEPSFINEVGLIRKKELSYLRKFLYLDCSINFIFSCAPTLVALVTFATYILSSSDNVFTTEKAFVSLALLNILRFPLFMIPTLLSNMIQTYVSVRRVTDFLVNSELDPNAVSHEDTPGVTAVIENGTLSWAPDAEPVLQNFTVYFPEGQSTAIVGRVGSGKSSLLSALLGNMELISGRVNIKGRLALVSQQAWIFNATLRDNILFHHPYDPDRYAKVIKACALETDIKLLPDGDLTDIGDKGVNLSGGQKQRVSFARACYSNADVYLLDDPLAAVDTHVATHLITHVLGRGGLLAGRTRIIATHNPSAIAAADRVVVLDAGHLVECGSYASLRGRPTSHLSAFLRAEKLRKKSEMMSESRPVTTASGPPEGGETSVALNRGQRRISTEPISNPHAPPNDLAELTLMDDEHLQSDLNNDEKLPSYTHSRSNSIKEKWRPDEKPNVSFKRTPSGEGDKTDGKQKRIQEEISATGRVKLGIFWMYARGVGLFFFFTGILCIVLTQLSWLGNNIWLADWSGGASKRLSPNETVAEAPKSVALRLGVYAIICAAQVIFNVMACALLSLGSVRASKILHRQLLDCILHVPVSFYDTVPQGRIVNRFSSDFATADNQLMISMRSMLMTMFGCIIAFALCILPSPYVVILLIFIVIFYGAMQNLFVTTTRQLKRLDSVSKSPIFSHFGETLHGMDTIRAYALCDLFVNINDRQVDANNRALFANLIANRWLSMILETMGNLLILSVSVAFVATRDSLNVGMAGLVIGYALNITQGLSWFVRMSTEFETNVVAVERIKEYSELPIEAPWEVQEKHPPEQWPEGRIEFINYSTRYRDDLDLVLRSISFAIGPGEKVGIVGRTGSGKSSLVLALFRIIEATQGEILIDGRNIAEIGLHDLRGHITLIPQDPVLFSGTLRFNLDPFNAYSDETVWEALTLANLRSFAEDSASDGLQTTIAEGGNNLSVGQRQLVCLARALLRRSRVLVLDEATAAVDPQTDQLIQRTVREKFASSTVLTIAHRLNTILDYDRIMVLDSGRLAEMGSPRELAGRSGSLFHGMLQEANLLSSVIFTLKD